MTVILSMSGPQRERNIFPGRNKKSVAINPRLGATTFVIILDVFVASTFESVSDFHRRKLHSKSFNFDSIVATRSIYPQNLFEWKTFLKYFGEHCAKIEAKMRAMRTDGDVNWSAQEWASSSPLSEIQEVWGLLQPIERHNGRCFVCPQTGHNGRCSALEHI